MSTQNLKPLSKFGYSRGVRRGPFIFTSGTTSVSTESTSTPTILHPSSAFHQALQAFSEIIRAVEALGGTKEDVVRVRMFVTRDEDSGEVGRALKEVFGDVGPAATMTLGVRFVSEEMRVEIEAGAVVLQDLHTTKSIKKDYTMYNRAKGVYAIKEYPVQLMHNHSVPLRPSPSFPFVFF